MGLLFFLIFLFFPVHAGIYIPISNRRRESNICTSLCLFRYCCELYSSHVLNWIYVGWKWQTLLKNAVELIKLLINIPLYRCQILYIIHFAKKLYLKCPIENINNLVLRVLTILVHLGDGILNPMVIDQRTHKYSQIGAICSRSLNLNSACVF